MNKKPFIHLHFHTAYSLLDGACDVAKTMKRAAELNMDAVAMTDHGVLYGTVEFYKAAKAAGIKPIIGCETYIAFGSRHERKHEPGKGYANHFVLLAETDEGYDNLIRLISLSHLEGFYYKPRIDKELLSQYHKGLIGMSACLKGEVAECLSRGDMDEAVRVAGEFSDIMGKDNFFLEMEDHGMPEQRLVNQGLVELAKRTGLPLVATNDVHYLEKEHSEAHDIMICLQTQAVFSDPKRMRYSSRDLYMKSADEMWELFAEVPEALHNTRKIADRCNVQLRLDTGELHFPQYKVPEGHSAEGWLIHLAKEGLQERYGIEDIKHPKDDEEKKVCDRFQFEMGVIRQTGFINYFLVVSDFIRFARDQGIPVGPGRGSGAGSLVAYVLGITGLDPLRYHLIFERFLNPERVSPPDFDIDFCQTRRGEVIEYVKEKYGRENVAQIITFGTLGAKTVIRDIGRVLELPFADCDRLAKMVPEDVGTTLESAVANNPDFKRAIETEEFAKRIMKFARVLEGLPRNAGIHAAGVVIGDKPLIEILPLSLDKNKEPVTQFEMKPLEATGLLKMDFLGLKTLTMIREAVDHIRINHGVEVDVQNLPIDDQETFDLLNRGDTLGVFQVESRGMRDLLRRIHLTQFEDLIAMIALYRPGPMNMLDPYVERKHGKVKITYDHPLLEEVLKETYGVMIYQEQVQRAANVLAGFSLAQGDLLRRAMGKKQPEEMAKQRQKFIDGCMKSSKIPAEKAGKIFDNIERFAGYGFNKSHSAAYAVVSWQTAWLKAHYPAEFMAALLSIEIGNTDKLPIYIAECREMDIEVRPPSVNESDVRFRPMKDGSIRFGMAGIKNAGTGAVEAIVRERQANGPYKDLIDFCRRLDSRVVNRKVIESLVKCGAFDFSGMKRGRVFAGIDFAMSRAVAVQDDLQRGQASLFDMLDEGGRGAVTDELPPADPWPQSTMLSAEKELLGFYISGHPLKEYEWVLQKFSQNRVADLPSLETESGVHTRCGGLVCQFTRRFTKKKNEQQESRPMGTFHMEGLEGAVDVVVFPRPFEQYGCLLADEAAVMVAGELRKKGEELVLQAKEIHALKDIPGLFSKCMSLHIPSVNFDEKKAEQLKQVLRRHPGNTPVNICLQYPDGEKVFMDTTRSFRVTPCEKLVNAVEHIIGEDAVYLDINPSTYLKEQKGRNGWNGF